MRKTIFKLKFLVVLFITLGGYYSASAYVPMFENTIWMTDEGGMSTHESRFYVKRNDSIINNKIYHTIYNYTWQSLTGLFREDTITQKIYIYEGVSERVLYDFSLKIGDAFPVILHLRIDQSLTLYVTNIDTVAYFGQNRKVITLRGGTGYDQYYIVWIEGCGSVDGIIYDDYNRYCGYSHLLGIYKGFERTFCIKEFFKNNYGSDCIEIAGDFHWSNDCVNDSSLFTFSAIEYPLLVNWDFGDGTANDSTYSDTSLACHVYKNPGEYTLQINVRSIDSLFTFSLNRKIIINEPIQVNISDTSSCERSFVEIDPGLTKGDITWSDHSSGPKLKIVKPGNYGVSISNGSCFTSDQFSVRLIKVPEIKLGNDTSLCSGENLELHVTTEMQKHWSTGDTASLLKIRAPQVVSVFVSNEHCIVADTFSLLSAELCEEKIYIPSAFTPNDDGINDVFRIDHPPLSQFSILIYNRWGAMVFSSADPDFSWNGTFNNQACQESIYFYVADFSTVDRKGKSLNGHLTILR